MTSIKIDMNINSSKCECVKVSICFLKTVFLYFAQSVLLNPVCLLHRAVRFRKKTEVIIHEWGQYACLILLVIISPFSLQELLPLRSQTLCHLNLLGFPILSVAVIN